MYCKSGGIVKGFSKVFRINSSKVYCKFKRVAKPNDWSVVLIVAKCIVNYDDGGINVIENKY